ncbi:hypothetical protein V1525DRAFT_408714 [Lipomyces kononenkoae]|uniref:Uncharacterized protein n=1 Tax=Lipomyces kononenkoae TaxID=34357 RepID=A0ACC3SWR1_LIPKO
MSDHSAALTSSITPPRTQNRRRHHIDAHSISLSVSASALAPPVTTVLSTASPSATSRIQPSPSSASSLSLSGGPHASSTPMTLAPTSTTGTMGTELSSSPIAQHGSSLSPLSKEERLRRRASQPVLVRSYDPNTSPVKQSRPGGSQRNGNYGGAGTDGGERKELLPVQYPAAGMFTVHAVLGSIGCSLPQFYETTFDLVEVCDEYFHTSGHLSPESVLGKGA